MGLRKGDMVKVKDGHLEGVVVGFKTAEYNSYYHKVTVFCTYSKFEPYYIGRHVDLDAKFVKRK
jgi:hypothetical protein